MSYFNGERIEDDFQQQEPVKKPQEQRTFTLQEMRNAFSFGHVAALRIGNDEPGYCKEEIAYFKEKFGINITEC